MLNDTSKARIKRFVSDTTTFEIVREVITQTFLKPRGDKDIHTLAASRIAIDLLDEAFRELKALSAEEKRPDKESLNPGL